MDVRNTKAWATAKSEYEELNVKTMMPFFGSPPSGQQIVERVERILRQDKDCRYERSPLL